MKKKDYWILFLIGLIFYCLIATIQKVPGYMDAEYYFGQSIRIASGKGLSEPFVWNYLNDPTTIPTAGFSFWLPLTSVIASVGLWIFKTSDFWVARIPIIILAAVIPLLSAYFAEQFLPGKRAGWLVAGLALFSDYYLPYVTITDTFTPFMVLGGLFFFILSRIESNKSRKIKGFGSVLLGIIIGLMTLSRSDGILWLTAGVFAIILTHREPEVKSWNRLINVLLLLIGFGLILTPWYARNIFLFSGIFPPGNRLMLWLTNYNDLFVYPSNVLNISRLLSTGLTEIVNVRLTALSTNLQTMIASGGSIFLLPLLMIGFWKHKRNLIVRLAGMMFLIIIGVMTVLFPFAGARGGFFHSLSSIQILLWAIVPAGLDNIIQWGIKHRNWKNNRAWIMFSLAVITAVIGLSAYMMFDKIAKGVEGGIPWNDSQTAYIEVEEYLKQQDNEGMDTVMINDPPGYTLATGRMSIMIPSGGPDAIIQVSEKFNVGFLVINDERSEVKKMINENVELRDHFQLLLNDLDTQIYVYKSE